MASDDNSSGLFYILAGAIVVVLAGVGISMMVDSGFDFSSNSVQIRRDIASGESELEKLQDAYHDGSAFVSRVGPKAQMVFDSYQLLLSNIHALNQRRSELAEAAQHLNITVGALKQEFDAYQDTYRAKTWAEAVGQSLGDLHVSGGRVYHKAVILEVDKVGLRIRHEAGSARVHAANLDSALVERFQWDAQECRAQLSEEVLNEESLTTSDRGGSLVNEKQRRLPQADSRGASMDEAKLALLRRSVSEKKRMVAQLTRDHREALFKIAAGRQVSIPGSLETWQARASRLTNALPKAQEQLIMAMALLHDVNPGDLLLVPDDFKP